MLFANSLLNETFKDKTLGRNLNYEDPNYRSDRCC